MKELAKIKGDNNRTIFPEHEFMASCLRIGLSISDLEKLTYVDVMKILFSFADTNNKKTTIRKATQADWDKLM